MRRLLLLPILVLILASCRSVEPGQVDFAWSGAFSYSLAVGSCAESASESPLFEHIAAREPLFYLQTGDFHYGDIESDCETAFPEYIGDVARSSTQQGGYGSCSRICARRRCVPPTIRTTRAFA